VSVLPLLTAWYIDQAVSNSEVIWCRTGVGYYRVMTLQLWTGNYFAFKCNIWVFVWNYEIMITVVNRKCKNTTPTKLLVLLISLKGNFSANGYLWTMNCKRRGSWYPWCIGWAKSLSLITNIYYKKTTYFYVTVVWPASVKMASIKEKAQCVLWSHETKSPVSVQRKFRNEYWRPPPDVKSIKAWYSKFVETGSVNEFNRSGRPLVSDETVDAVREAQS